MWKPKVIGYSIIVILERLGNSIGNIGNDGVDFKTFTPDSIFFNHYKITDINFFEVNRVGDANIVTTIKKSVAFWYYVMRIIALSILLGVLIYVGIRMAISTVASEKAMYKKMLVDWASSFALVFLMHYIILATITVSNKFVEILANLQDAKDGFANITAQLITLSLSLNFFVGFGCIILAGLILILTFIFLFSYMKRMFTVAFLIIISPLITITYSIDKMNDGKSQALNNWLKEFMLNVLIQPFHCILYLVFAQLALVAVGGGTDKLTFESFFLGNGSFGGVIFGICALVFIKNGEKIVKKIFGFDQASSLVSPMATGAAMYSLIQKAGNVANKSESLNKYVNKSTMMNKISNTKVGQKVINPLSDKVTKKMDERKENKISKYENEYKNQGYNSEQARQKAEERYTNRGSKKAADFAKKTFTSQGAKKTISGAVAAFGAGTALLSSEQGGIVNAALIGKALYQGTNDKFDKWQKQKKSSYESDSVGNFVAYARTTGQNHDLSTEEGMNNYKNYINSNHRLGKELDYFSDDRNDAYSEKMTKKLEALGLNEIEAMDIKAILAKSLNDDNAINFDPSKFYEELQRRFNASGDESKGVDKFKAAIDGYIIQQLGANMFNYTSQFDTLMENSGITHEAAIQNVEDHPDKFNVPEVVRTTPTTTPTNIPTTVEANFDESEIEKFIKANTSDNKTNIENAVQMLESAITEKISSLESDLASSADGVVSQIQADVQAEISSATAEGRQIDMTKFEYAGDSKKKEYAETIIQREIINNNKTEIYNHFENIVNNIEHKKVEEE